jgi:hypothetical protein
MNYEREGSGKESARVEFVSYNFPEGKNEKQWENQDRLEVRKEYLQNTSMEIYSYNSLSEYNKPYIYFFKYIPAVATDNLNLFYSVCSLHVSAPTGHHQVKHNIIYIFI